MRSYFLRLSVSALVLLTSAASVVAAQPANPATKPPIPLGLLRLKDDVKADEAAKLAASKFAVDDLSAVGVTGATKSKRDQVDVLALDAGKEWSRPLRGNARDVTFVSFQVHASQTTIIDIGGARLGLTAGPITGSFQLMYDDSTTGAPQWQPLNLHFSAAQYSGQSLAALPPLTVRLDPAAGVWDLYAGGWLMADGLPLLGASKNDRRFALRAGTGGAWVMGLVLADENPIYEDENNNGIDDRFERTDRRGALLPANASRAERQSIAQRWRDAQHAAPPPPLLVARPFSDRVTTAR